MCVCVCVCVCMTVQIRTYTVLANPTDIHMDEKKSVIQMFQVRDQVASQNG